MAKRLHLSKMREARRALSVRQANICHLKVPRLSRQCVAHGHHGYEIQPHAIICLVLGRVPCDNADARAIGSSIPKTTRSISLRNGVSIAPQTPRPVEVDETLVGGRTKGEGRGIHHKTTVVGAIEVRTQQPAADSKKQKRISYAGRLRLRLVPDRGAKELTKFVVAKGAVVRTDGWKGYDDLATLGYTHEPLVLDGDPERTEAHLPMMHIAFSNLKTWLLGTHHGVSPHHLQAYLNEFVFRFNRRFYPMTAFNSALGLAAHASAPTYKTLYSGDWTHPAT
jgi:hypothetical protein